MVGQSFHCKCNETFMLIMSLDIAAVLASNGTAREVGGSMTSFLESFVGSLLCSRK